MAGARFDAEVAVVGVGSVGAMAMWRVVAQGVPVIGFEQFTPGHARGAAGGETRVFRVAYHEGSHYVPLLLRAREAWSQLERLSGRKLFDPCGYLEIAPCGDGKLAQTLEAVRAYSLDHSYFEAVAAQARYPQHRFRADDVAVLDRSGGVLFPGIAVEAAALHAEELGARILRGTRVEAIEPDDDGVTIVTGAARFRVRSAIVSAGAWTGAICPELRPAVVPTRLSLTWFGARRPSDFSSRVFPAFGRTVDGVFVYGVPSIDGRSVKVAATRIDEPGPIDPDWLDPVVPPDVVDEVSAVVAATMPGLDPHPVRQAIFADGYTTDGDGLVGLHPNQPHVVVATGLSGHGFKLAPSFGKAAADLAIYGVTTEPVDFLDPGRPLAFAAPAAGG
ncbi:MAG TPA: N-methyl-L-tryptophan oxidase [Acidimicrobiales bacterium]|nr:N-methyl-L-tryptophan oxidase [Acidimicrobiales bacterium]